MGIEIKEYVDSKPKNAKEQSEKKTAATTKKQGKKQKKGAKK